MAMATRDLMLMTDKLACETRYPTPIVPCLLDDVPLVCRGKDNWNARYGPEFGLNLKGERDVLDCYPDLTTASSKPPTAVSICASLNIIL